MVFKKKVKKFKLKKLIPFKFLKKYAPISNLKDLEYLTTKVEGREKYVSILFPKALNLEYIANKNTNYVWSVVKDAKEGLLLVPGHISEANYFIIATVPNYNKNEYVNLNKKISFKS